MLICRDCFLKEEDIPKNDVPEGSEIKGIGFGPAILTLAKSPSVQAKIRSLDAPALSAREK